MSVTVEFLAKQSTAFFPSIGIGYKVVVTTGESGVNANVILCIFGQKGSTAKLPLRTTKDGSAAKFDENSVLEFNLKATDVGEVGWGMRVERRRRKRVLSRSRRSTSAMMGRVMINGGS